MLMRHLRNKNKLFTEILKKIPQSPRELFIEGDLAP
jgi:hypothetical protein